MAGELGVRVSKEILDDIFSIIHLILVEVKGDGLTSDDIKKILFAPEALKLFSDLASNLPMAKREMKEIDFLDGIELGKFCIDRIFTLIRG